jgi:NAD(P)-dependent dehydrogenase (short-subunit alcohol dehydrogenase family)
MARFGDPKELFGAVQWLSSEASKFVTGTIIEIDGGFSAYSGV